MKNNIRVFCAVLALTFIVTTFCSVDIYAALTSYPYSSLSVNAPYHTETPDSSTSPMPTPGADELSSSANPAAILKTKFQETKNSSKKGDTKIKSTLPTLIGIKNSDFQSTVNTAVNVAYNDFLNQISESTTSVDISYTIKTYGNYLSIVLNYKAKSATSQVSVTTIVIDAGKEKIISLSDCLGPNGVKMANSVVTNAITTNPAKYSSTFKGLTKNHDFYLDAGTLYIAFDKYEIASGSEGVVLIPLKLNKIIELEISSDDYYVKPDSYNVKMIMLRQVADEFGFSLNWSSATASVEVVKNGLTVVSFKLGENNYTKGKTKRQLESAPEANNSRTYVPITFLSDYMNIFYSTQNDGTVVLTAYDFSKN